MEFRNQNKKTKGKKTKREKERETKKQTLNYREKTDGYQRGSRGPGMGYIGDGD